MSNIMLIRIACIIGVAACIFGITRTNVRYLKMVLLTGAAFLTMFIVGTVF